VRGALHKQIGFVVMEFLFRFIVGGLIVSLFSAMGGVLSLKVLPACSAQRLRWLSQL